MTGGEWILLGSVTIILVIYLKHCWEDAKATRRVWERTLERMKDL